MNFVIPMFMQPGDGNVANNLRLPYIGVTGFTSRDDIESAIDTYFTVLDSSASHDFMAGVLVSHHSLSKDGQSSKHPARYPAIDLVPELLGTIKSIGGKHAIATVHYNTKNPYLHDDVGKLIDVLGTSIDAIQFNVGFVPDECELRKIKALLPARIIVQINNTIASEHGTSFIATSVSSLPVDHVLIDPSGGKGKNIDVDASITMYNALHEKTTACIGFAGGFGPENVEEKTREYIQKLGTTRFSIDAEGKLRNPVTDVMDMEKVIEYLRGFFRCMS